MRFSVPSPASLFSRLTALMSTPTGPPIRYLWSPSYQAIIPAEDWADSIKTNSDDRIAQCFVATMEQLKCQNGKEHEFLLVKVQYGTGNNSPTTRLVTDRCIKDVGSGGHGNSKRSSQILIAGSAAPVSSHKIHSTPSPRSLPDADDRVYCGGSIQPALTDLHPYVSLRKLSFQNTFPVTSLAVLLTIVSLEKPNYRPDDSQCFWYANTIYAAALLLFRGTESEDLLYGRFRGTYLDFKIQQADSVQTVATKCRNELKKYKETREARRNTVSTAVVLHRCCA
jgi:hypothetical protein